MIEQLVARLFATRDAAHLRHWMTTDAGSFAEHSALGEFYDGIIDQLDKIVEAYIGRDNAVGDVKPATVRFADKDAVIEHLVAEAEWIEANTAKISKRCAAIENMLDELGGIYLGALYKLRRLS